jgi:hypothetical protein
VGDKKSYDPRVWSRAGQTAMAERIGRAAHQLGSAGHTLRPQPLPTSAPTAGPLLELTDAPAGGIRVRRTPRRSR